MPDARHPRHDSIEQPSLFLPEPPLSPLSIATPRPPVAELPTLTADSPLDACPLPYQDYLRRTDHSEYTVTCFLSDLRLLADFLGHDLPVRRITAAELAGWLNHLKYDRGDRPAPKTLARRVTFLKNFCGWLVKSGLLASDPSERIALSRPSPPLPELLHDDEIARLLVAAAEDVRCHLLVLLLLSTGLKKEEIMRLRPQDVDLSDAEHPAIEVHFPGQAKRRRERRMELPAEWTGVYTRYVARFHPRERVFECTDRNLNYVLAAAVRRARIDKRVTLQLLRDVYAVSQLRAGVSLDALREKLGLSEEAWHESAEKYRKLAFPA